MAKELLRVEHIGMKFNLSKERVNDFREYVIRMLKGKKLEKDEFWALKDINFSIHEGERIGILFKGHYGNMRFKWSRKKYVTQSGCRSI